MRRSLVWPLSLLLALATGAAIAQAVELTTPPIPDTIRTGATIDTVRAFYETANAVIQYGDPSALETVVAAGYVDHTGLPGVTPDLAGLGRYLVALHAVTPKARLTTQDVLANGDRAMVRVAIGGTGDSAFLGVAIRGAAPIWDDADVFRVAGRRVVERWGSGQAMVAFQTGGQVTTGAGLPAKAGLALERVVVAPGERAPGPAMESRLIEIEAGTIAVAVETASPGPALLVQSGSNVPRETPQPVAPGTTATLSAGDLIALPRSTAYTLTNNHPASATLLVVASFPADDPMRAVAAADPAIPASAGPWPATAAVQSLIGGTAADLAPGMATAGIGRLTLAPGAWLPALMPPGPLMIFVESGSLDFATSDGLAWVRSGGNGASQDKPAGSLGAGDGALLRPGATLSLRNPGESPAVVLVAAITPDR